VKYDIITFFLKGQSSRGSKKYRKPKQKDFNSTQLIDEEHWSRNNKYDGDLFLESTYRKHLSRHANKLVFVYILIIFFNSHILIVFYIIEFYCESVCCITLKVI